MPGMWQRIYVHDRQEPGEKALRPLGGIRRTGKQNHQVFPAEALTIRLDDSWYDCTEVTIRSSASIAFKSGIRSGVLKAATSEPFCQKVTDSSGTKYKETAEFSRDVQIP